MSEELLHEQSGYSGDSWSQNIDSETGLYYRQRHASPYWDNQISQCFQTQRAVGPVKGLRIYIDDGDSATQFSCSAGKVYFGGELHSYAGANTLALTASQTNYIYLDLTDDTLNVNVSGFPNVLDAPHVKVATIACGASSWAIDTNLVEYRYQQTLTPDYAGRTYTRRFRVQYSDLTDADTSQTLSTFSLPAYHAVIDAYVEVVTAFSGGSVSALAMDLGVAADVDQYIDSIDMMSAADYLDSTAKGARFTSPGNTGIESLTGATQISAIFTSTGDNLDNLSAGDCYIYLTIRADESDNS